MKQSLHHRKPAPNTSGTSIQPGTRSGNPAELARARKLVQAKSWEDRFEFFLAEDRLAQSALNHVLKQGTSRHHVIAFLEAAADPQTGDRLQRLSREKDDTRGLIYLLQKAAKRIRLFWERPTTLTAMFLQERSVALSTAAALDAQATLLGESHWGSIAKKMSYKTFWSQVPIGILCWNLKAPDQVSYVDLSRLCGVALTVRRSFKQVVKPKGYTPRALAASYSRFCRREAGRYFMTIGGFEVIASLLPTTLQK